MFWVLILGEDVDAMVQMQRNLSTGKRSSALYLLHTTCLLLCPSNKKKRKNIDGCVSVLLVVGEGVLLMLLHLSSVGVCFPQHVCVNAWKGDVG